MFQGNGVSCPVVVTSYRVGERVTATTVIDSSETALCRNLIAQTEVQYIPVGSDSVKSTTASGTGGLYVVINGARDLTRSKHTVGLDAWVFGCLCTDYTVDHPK